MKRALGLTAIIILALTTITAVAYCTVVHCDIDGAVMFQESCDYNGHTQVCKFSHDFIDEHGRKIRHSQYVDCGN